MNDLLNTPLVWVDQDKTLADSLGSLRDAKRIAVDTESNSLFAYQEQVCLIQISDQDKDYLIDGMAGLDLSTLGAIFADDCVEKIFHAAEYDIICMKRDFNFTFTNLFDTMQAARILGFEKLGLANLLEDLFNVQQGKSFQKANWGKRPLTSDMLDYARMDTHFLSELRDYLRQQLIEKDLLDLAREDFQRLCKVEANHKDTPLYSQVNGYHNLDPQQMRVLERLCQYRNKQAQKLNRPLFKVISNSALLAVAKACPHTLADLKKVREVSPKLIDRYAHGLLKAVEEGLQMEPIQLKTRKRPSQAYLNRLDGLKEWRKVKAQVMGVQSDIILPRDILENIVGRNPADEEALQVEMSEIPWRFKHFGAEIMVVIRKQVKRQ